MTKCDINNLNTLGLCRWNGALMSPQDLPYRCKKRYFKNEKADDTTLTLSRYRFKPEDFKQIAAVCFDLYHGTFSQKQINSLLHLHGRVDKLITLHVNVFFLQF